MRRINMQRDLGNGITEITTTKGIKHIIDTEDKQKITCHSWCVSKTGYLVASISGKTTKLHRYLLCLTNPKIVVDHINGNPFDNRKKNLRICTNSENARNCKLSKNNRTGYTGIRLNPNGKWQARISLNRHEHGLGTYDSFEEAVEARKAGEKKYFGKFSPHLGALGGCDG